MEGINVIFNDLQRYGNPMFKCRLTENQHIFGYEYKGYFFTYILTSGRLSDISGNFIDVKLATETDNPKPFGSELIKGSPEKSKGFEELFKSSSNEYKK